MLNHNLAGERRMQLYLITHLCCHCSLFPCILEGRGGWSEVCPTIPPADQMLINYLELPNIFNPSFSTLACLVAICWLYSATSLNVCCVLWEFHSPAPMSNVTCTVVCRCAFMTIVEVHHMLQKLGSWNASPFCSLALGQVANWQEHHSVLNSGGIWSLLLKSFS